MTPMELIDLAALYDRKLDEMNVPAERSPPARHAPVADDERTLRHARWMCGEIETMAKRTMELMAEMALAANLGHTIREEFVEVRLLEGKACRWIGFVQGVLWSAGVYTIDEMREHVKLDEAALEVVQAARE